MKRLITIVDYGSGNILSAKKSFSKVIEKNNLDAEVVISEDPKFIKNSSHVVLPGQGAFKTCMEGLKSIPGMIEELNNFALKRTRPFFGICVGMQLLADSSSENGNHSGLGWISGSIEKLPSINLKMPHMGWNTIKNVGSKSEIIFRELDYYFVHSYYYQQLPPEYLLATTDYSDEIPAIIGKDNIIATQFHPEKSQQAGQKFLNSFLHWQGQP